MANTHEKVFKNVNETIGIPNLFNNGERISNIYEPIFKSLKEKEYILDLINRLVNRIKNKTININAILNPVKLRGGVKSKFYNIIESINNLISELEKLENIYLQDPKENDYIKELTEYYNSSSSSDVKKEQNAIEHLKNKYIKDIEKSHSKIKDFDELSRELRKDKKLRELDFDSIKKDTDNLIKEISSNKDELIKQITNVFKIINMKR